MRTTQQQQQQQHKKRKRKKGTMLNYKVKEVFQQNFMFFSEDIGYKVK